MLVQSFLQDTEVIACHRNIMPFAEALLVGLQDQMVPNKKLGYELFKSVDRSHIASFIRKAILCSLTHSSVLLCCLTHSTVRFLLSYSLSRCFSVFQKRHIYHWQFRSILATRTQKLGSRWEHKRTT